MADDDAMTWEEWRPLIITGIVMYGSLFLFGWLWGNTGLVVWLILLVGIIMMGD